VALLLASFVCQWRWVRRGWRFQWREAVQSRWLAETERQAGARKRLHGDSRQRSGREGNTTTSARARRLLDGIDSSLRGFEWRLLRRLCRGDETFSREIGMGEGLSAAMHRPGSWPPLGSPF